MLAPRPVHFFLCLIACLIALGIAACASTSGQGEQTSVSGAPPRPKTVLVNDFVVSPDVTVVDRDFTARLESKLGNPANDVIKALAAKRVNDEVVATIIVILHYEAGLNTQPSSDVEIGPKDGSLVITGQLHAVDQGNRPQRNPVAFGTGGVAVADITVSQVSEGTKKQLLTFTAQTQSGRQSGATSIWLMPWTRPPDGSTRVWEPVTSTRLPPQGFRVAPGPGPGPGERRGQAHRR